MRRPICTLSTTTVVFLASMSSGTVLAAVAGPDAAGYTLADQADGAVYNYVDITSTGTVLANGDEVLSPVTALGAPFEFYGAVVNDVRVSTNGFITSAAGTSADFSNDCPLPSAPGGGGFRIAPLHDDFVTTVYYQYFDEAGAAALGYPGETAGISVVQWDGQHFAGAVDDFVNLEAVLFHDDFSILTMVALDAEAGASSTLGIQNEDASIALNYICNVGGSVIPGVTSVMYSPGTPPDSDCCSPSVAGIPGCVSSSCQSAVCAINPFCCETEWDVTCADDAAVECPVSCGPPPPLTINEIRMDQTGTDDDEYFEIVGPPGTPLTNIQYIVLGDTPTGEIEAVIDLTGNVIPPSGFFTVAEGTFTLGVADVTASLNFENLDTTTHLLVGGFSGALSDNLDGNADGVLDTTPWIVALDTVAMVHPPSTDLAYGPDLNCVAGPVCQEVSDGIDGPFQVFRCGDATGTWQIGNDDLATVPATDTPGAANACAGCGNGVLDMGEDCDDGGESALCNADCSFAACGDGQINMTAGEVCDDAGESAACNADCTVASCGDGVTNAAAGEDCDDAGESATCNADCSLAACGDGQINVAAGETCDDSGESATCNVDCTDAACGDGVFNMTSGEACDDGGRSDMCNADCTIASCGDGVVNAAAGEACDDMSETATCDADCTDVMCGDSVLNATAGEACDDGGESKNCDDDCTFAECGDGVTNASANEECDDGNTEDGDGCAADCTDEGGGSTGGDGTGGDSTGGDESTGDSAGSSGPSTVTAVTDATMTTGATGDETDGDTDTSGAAAGDDGCSCRSDGRGESGTPWSVFALLGLGAIGRRRRRR